ncbi:methyltransferase domain-containing protein [Paenibacillus campinasensis]|uniref:Methyltransferase domain-containing protein n=1 Tax=Paenibacillus campinasensis TaxID=66347 RepID=A0ABW9TA48_9BACL|nr:class I SAM-dependent methyltransferase [Paenibacillus campinasensis]MUG68031.1 methyltransferase domain-containing protein [Paenibacillus campinasensis]
MIPLVYDQVNHWGRDDEFFLALLKSLDVKRVADLGCGTGRWTMHLAREGYDITAIDPNPEAIEVAKAKDDAHHVTWIIGDSTILQTNAYDAVIMTANVAQVFLTDESWEQTISDVYRSLRAGGHYIFDTRNPLAKAWEAWEKDAAPDAAKDMATGDPLKIHTKYEGFEGDIFTFYETVKHARTGEVLIHEKMQIRFRNQEELTESLKKAGFTRVTTYGDWELKQATPEHKSFVFHCIK